MNLEKLFEVQDGLDFHIKKERGLMNKNLFEEDILGLQLKIGELADRQRTWKYWTDDKYPRNNVYTCIKDNLNIVTLPYAPTKEDHTITIIRVDSPLMNSFCSSLSFLIKVSLHLQISPNDIIIRNQADDIRLAKCFNNLFAYANVVYAFLDEESPFSVSRKDVIGAINDVFNSLFCMNQMYFGFTHEEVERNFLERNRQYHEELNYAKGEVM
ncbi:dUTP diphosphatase [Oceanobacillus oncorhynchi]|uniref:dUTP diphosphatase n=1 Tax=Oceanobacillus oncorhynchi TaxID=545501 RepID=UPI0034D5C90C